MSSLPQIRNQYLGLQQLANSNKGMKITTKDIQQNQRDVQTCISEVQQNNEFEKIQELLFYKEKYDELLKAVKKAKVQMVPPSRYQEIVQNILKSSPSVKINVQAQEQIQKPMSFKPRGSYVRLDAQQHPMIQQRIEYNAKSSSKQIIDAFFATRNNTKAPLGFKSVIESPNQIPVSSWFKKRHPPNKDVEIKRLMEENRKLHDELKNKTRQEQQMNEFQKNLLIQQKNKCAERIQQLQSEIQQLSKDNYKLKQWDKSNQYNFSTSNIGPPQEKSHSLQIYAPYIIPTKPNDLARINEKNANHKYNQQQYPYQKQKYYQNPNEKILRPDYDYQNKQANLFKPNPTHSTKQPMRQRAYYPEDPLKQSVPFRSNQQPIPHIQNNFLQSPSIIREEKEIFSLEEALNASDSMYKKNQFDTFQMAGTFYYDNSQFLNASRQQTAIDSKTSTRNKVAFFKKSLIIVKDPQYQIAFKRSDLDRSLSSIRIIFYILNKTDYKQPAKINYDYESSHYTLAFEERVTQVKPYEQVRQSFVITLNDKQNLNSVIDMHVLVGNRRFDLWVPACFINFTAQPKPPLMVSGQLTVQPDRQFTTYQNMASIAPLIYEGRDGQAIVGHLYGQSIMFRGGIKLIWFQKQLTIETSEKWLDFIGFILHRYK